MKNFTLRRIQSRLSTRSKLLMAFLMALLLTSPFVLSPSLLRPGHAQTAKIKKTEGAVNFAIDAPYWSVEEGFISTIEMKNYRVDQSLTITPVLYPLHGREIALDPVTLKPSETRLINLNEALAAQHKNFTIGSAEIRYSHTTESVFGANLTVLNVSKSLIYNFQFRMPDESTRLEGLWWFYDQNTDGFVAVQNTSDAPIIATPILYAQERPYQLGQFHLQPHEMRLIELRKELRKLGLEAISEGGIRIESSKPGAVIAGGGLVNPEIGFSAPLRMDDPDMQAMRAKRLGQTLHALNVAIGADDPMMGMGLPPGTLMNPIMNLRNVAGEAIRVTPVFKYQDGNTTKSFALPEVQLNPQQTARVDLLPYWESGQIPQGVSWGSLEISYTGNPGSLVASVASVDQTGTYVFDAKIDNRLAAGFEGEYWSTEGANNTSITIKNITGKEAKGWITLQYDKGRKSYEMQPLTLQPGESHMIDLKMLQMEKVADAKGQVLPESATFGGLTLTEEPGGRHFLMDAVVFNPKTATCGVCGFGCLYPNSLFFDFAEINILEFELSNLIGVSARMCNGTIQHGWECSCNFSSDDPTIATVDPSCQARATGVNPGATYLRGTAVDVPGPACGDQTLTCRSNVTVRPSVLISGPNGVPLAGTMGILTPAPIRSIQLTGTGNPSGGTFSWTSNSSNVTLTNTTSDTVTVTSVTESSAMNDVTVTLVYTVNGRGNSATKQLTVQKPTYMGFFSKFNEGPGTCPDDPRTGNPQAGWVKSIVWQVEDRLHNAVQLELPTYDTLTGSSQNACFVSRYEGTPPGGSTGLTGLWAHDYGLCSTVCISGTCTSTGTQSFFVNGWQIDLPFTFQCNNITVNGY